MKKIILCTVFLTAAICGSMQLTAQGFSGFRAGKNSGVNGVFYNPASMAGSNYKWDVNLGSAHVEWGFNSRTGSDTIFSKGVKNIRTAQLVTESLRANGYIHVDVFGPSAMMRLNPRASVAFTTRYRVLGNLHEAGGSVSGSEKDSLYSFSGSGLQKAVVNAWSETGVSFATVLAKTDDYTVSAGVTAKYLRGDANLYAGLQDFSGTAFTGEHAYLTNAYGRFTSGGTVRDCDDDVKGHGLSMDMGVVLEKAAPKSQAHRLKYKYRLGVALRDVGAIAYNISSDQHLNYSMHIPANQRFYVNELDNKTTEEVKQYFNQHPGWFTNNIPGNSKYKVVLPATALISLDVAVAPGFYVDMNALLSLAGRKDDYSSFLPHSVSVTPRFESRIFSVYAPVSYNEISGISSGLSVKLGPVFIGSNSLFNSVFGGDLLDVHAGIRFGLRSK